MKDRYLFEEITALADNEIKDEARIKELLGILSNNTDLQEEFNIQTSVKSLLNQRFAKRPAPSYLTQKILRKTTRQKKFVLFDFDILKRNVFRPQFAFTMLFLIIAGYLLFSPISPIDTSILIAQQKGNSNMYVQAINNFGDLISGNLNLQCSSGDPNFVREYLKQNGIAYSLFIPTNDNWELEGCIVTDNSKIKLAHQVYKGKNNETLYLFQIEESYLTDENGIELSDDLMLYLNRGNILKCNENPDYCAFIWKTGGKIFTLISNSRSELIENTFLELFK